MRRRNSRQESRASGEFAAKCCNYFRSSTGSEQRQQWPAGHLQPRRLSFISPPTAAATRTTSTLLIMVVFCWLQTTQDWRVGSQQLQIASLKEQQQPPNVDFSNLAQLFKLQPTSSGSSSSLFGSSVGHGWAAAADPNNRTTMRFFRNNKTFASVVYANEQPVTHQLLNLPTNSHNQDHPNQQQQRQQNFLNRLINCHLVDLEKHSTDVALFESKYGIRTVDIEFADMMQLIEACTEIERLRMPPINRLAAAVGSNSNGSGNGTKLAASSALINAATNLPQPRTAIQKPLLVVGRPIPVIPAAQPSGQAAMTTATSTSASVSTPSATSARSLTNEQQQPPSSSSPPPPLSIVADWSSNNQPDLGGRRARRRIAPQSGPQQAANQAGTSSSGKQLQTLQDQQLFQHQHQHQHPQQQQQQQQQQQELVHRLTLGEVTPPASLVVNTKIREALQEITSYDTSDLMSIWRGILPGTNWCGMGDRATSYNDLGFESDIDICCRAHDFCPIRLSAFSSGYGLFNWSFYTRSHCRCDQNFLDCLRRAESPLASVVMKFYFAIMKTTCLHDNQTSLSQTYETDANGGSGSSSKSRQHSQAAGSSMMNGNKLMAGSKMFEQLKSKLPIPRAVERSQPLLDKIDTKQTQQQPPPQQQHQMQQQQMQRYASTKNGSGGSNKQTAASEPS